MFFRSKLILFYLIHFIKVTILQSIEDNIDFDRKIQNRDKSDWVDPHDIKPTIIKSSENVDVSFYGKNGDFLDDRAAFTYFRHFVKKFLSNLNVDIEKMSQENITTFNKTFDVEILLNWHQLYVFKRTIDGQKENFHANILQDYLEAFGSMIGKVEERQSFEPMEMSAWSIFQDPLSSFMAKYSTFLHCLLLSIYFMLILAQLFKCSFRMLFFTSFCIMCLLSVFVTWYRLVEEKRSEMEALVLKGTQNQCYKIQNSENDGNFLQNVFHSIRGVFSFKKDDPCVEYRKLKNIDPFWHVTIFHAISVTATETFFGPLKLVGQFIGEFYSALLVDLPLQTWLPVLGTLLILVLMVFFFAGGYRMSAFFGLLKFEPSGQNERLLNTFLQNQNVSSAPNLLNLENSKPQQIEQKPCPKTQRPIAKWKSLSNLAN